MRCHFESTLCFTFIFQRWREDEKDIGEEESETESINDYNLYGVNESKFLDEIIQISEKRSKFDVVGVGLVASTNMNGKFLS